MDIVIVGAGPVGRALGTRWRAAGHDARFASREPGGERQRAVQRDTGIGFIGLEDVGPADVVVLAVPWIGVPAVCAVLARRAPKVVLDATNPLAPGLQLAIGHASSGGESVAGWLPGSHVVKVFNSTGHANLADARYGGERPTLFYCGDDREACALAHALAADLGFEPLRAGPLSEARTLEPLALLWIRLAVREGLGTGIAFKLLRR